MSMEALTLRIWILTAAVLTACSASNARPSQSDAGMTADGGTGLCDVGRCATTFSAPVRASDGAPGTTQREPTVAIDSQGKAYVAYMHYPTIGDQNHGAIRWASTADGGGTFSPSVAVCPNDLCGNPVLSVDRDDRVFLTFGGKDMATQDRFTYVTRIDSRTDNPRQVLQVSRGPVNKTDREWFALGRNGEIYVTYQFRYHDVGAPVMFTKSLDHGATFDVPVVALPADADGAPIYGAIAVDRDGVITVVGPMATFGPDVMTAIHLVRSTDGGASFTSPATLSGVLPTRPPPAPWSVFSYLFLNFPIVEAAPDGTVIVSIAEQLANAGAAPINVYRLPKDATAFSPAIRANDDGLATMHLQNASAMDENGILHLTWIDARFGKDDATPTWDVFYSSSIDSGASFAPNVKLSPARFLGDPGIQEGQFATGEFQGVAARNRKVHVVWTSSAGGDPDVFIASGSY
jgi:hypothetical protein